MCIHRYSLSVLNGLLELLPPPSLWAQCALIGHATWKARCCSQLFAAAAHCCEEQRGFRVGDTDTARTSETQTHSRSKNNKCGLILTKKKVYNAVSMGLRRTFLCDPSVVARKTFTHLNSRGRYLVCFKHHKYTNNNEYLQVVYPSLPLVQTK